MRDPSSRCWPSTFSTSGSTRGGCIRAARPSRTTKGEPRACARPHIASPRKVAAPGKLRTRRGAPLRIRRTPAFGSVPSHSGATSRIDNSIGRPPSGLTTSAQVLESRPSHRQSDSPVPLLMSMRILAPVLHGFASHALPPPAAGTSDIVYIIIPARSQLQRIHT